MSYLSCSCRNIKHIKEIYKDYFFQVDGQDNEEQLLEEMAVTNASLNLAINFNIETC